ncbi:MAG: CBS domain-containing protein, partial [Oscillospiraceae bacterium]|nr:CBS domain-containing protein [Oscillospiraceae bacterium]
MDADSWQSISLILCLYLCAGSSLYTGVSSEESSANEPAGTGLGLSLRTLSSASLALTFAGAASAFFYALIGRRALPAGIPALLLFLFWLAVLMLALFLPCFYGVVRSEQLAGKLKVTRALCTLFTPVAALLALPARALVLRANGGRGLDEVTEEDVMELVDIAEDDVIDKEQKEMISNIFELDDAECGDMAIHRTEVTAVPLSAAVDEVVALAVSSGYSRLPVYDGTLDRILGVYHVKDLLPYLQNPALAPDPRSLIRPVMFVSESYKATALLRDFRQKKAHLAVVVDEYGGTQGIVTLEDILESIVG